MRNERKAAKRQAQRKRYVLARNRNKYVRKVSVELTRTIYHSETDPKTHQVTITPVGERKFIKKYEPEGYNRQLTAGDGILPKSRKFTSATTTKK